MLFEYLVYDCVAFILKANYVKTRKRCFSLDTLNLLSVFCSLTSKARIKHKKKRFNLGTVFWVETIAPTTGSWSISYPCVTDPAKRYSFQLQFCFVLCLEASRTPPLFASFLGGSGEPVPLHHFSVDRTYLLCLSHSDGFLFSRTAWFQQAWLGRTCCTLCTRSTRMPSRGETRIY